MNKAIREIAITTKEKTELINFSRRILIVRIEIIASIMTPKRRLVAF